MGGWGCLIGDEVSRCFGIQDDAMRWIPAGVGLRNRKNFAVG